MASGLLAWPGVAEAADEAPLVPRRVFFRDPGRTVPRLSPDGRSLAWLEPHDGALNLVMSAVENTARPRRLTFVTGRSLSSNFAWAFTNKHLVFFRDEAGDENYRPFSVAVDTGEVLPLLPAGGRSFLQQRARRTPNEMLFGHNARDRALFDLIRVDITTGEGRPLFQNPGFARLHTTADFSVRFGRRFPPQRFGRGDALGAGWTVEQLPRHPGRGCADDRLGGHQRRWPLRLRDRLARARQGGADRNGHRHAGDPGACRRRGGRHRLGRPTTPATAGRSRPTPSPRASVGTRSTRRGRSTSATSGQRRARATSRSAAPASTGPKSS